ncbi:MAG: polyprenyl synthetase family protein [Alistipes sp.]|nr:polyprenyl synthetase family protein [Candidatus Alistipes equi]
MCPTPYNKLLEQFERSLSLLSFPEDPQNMYSPITYALSAGGKRIRPTLLLLAYNIYRDDTEKAMGAAFAVEILHNFTLVHDDIMDKATLRRGLPSVVAKWNSNSALLSGDAMLVTAYTFLEKINPEMLPCILSIFNQMALKVCEGQQLDLDFEKREKVTVVEFLRMTELKTSFLLGGSVAMGATLAGAQEDDIEKLRSFASDLGIAFQMQDDLLDCFGDDSFGKKIGGDILEGKMTFLKINAISRANDEQRNILRETHLRKDLTTDEKINTIKDLYVKLGVVSLIENQIKIHISRAISYLDSLSVKKEKLDELKSYTRSLLGRHF